MWSSELQVISNSDIINAESSSRSSGLGQGRGNRCSEMTGLQAHLLRIAKDLSQNETGLSSVRLWVLENNQLVSRSIHATTKVALFREEHDFCTRSVIRLGRTTISEDDERGRMSAAARPRVRNCGLLTDRECFRVSLSYLFSAIDRDMQTLGEANLLTSKVSSRKYDRCEMRVSFGPCER